MRNFSLVLVLAAACNSAGSKSAPGPSDAGKSDSEPKTAPAAPAATADKAPTETCAALPSWRFERIVLPPEFAPALPAGVEKLYFAPGMFKPDAADHWSYVFSLSFETAAPTDAAALTDLLELYYEGLIDAVAKGKKLTLPEDSASITVKATDGGFDAVIKTFDAFTDGAAISVNANIRLGAKGRCLNVAASAGSDKAVWADLEKARACVPCP